MLLSQNQKTFGQFLSAFPESIKNLEYYENKDEPRRLFVSEILNNKRRGYLNPRKAAYQNTYRQSTC